MIVSCNNGHCCYCQHNTGGQRVCCMCGTPEQPALPQPEGWQPKPEAVPLVVASKGGHTAWWVCFRCWKAFYVPTTGYFGDCDSCGKPTQRWPADPIETLRLIEWRRPLPGASSAPIPPAPLVTETKEPT